MQDILINKLHEYISENNPDLLLQLEEEGKITEYLFNKVSAVNILRNPEDEQQPPYIVEEACMDALTQDLRPSKFNYIHSILEEEFETTYQQLQKSGILKFEIINLINKCQSAFEDLKFSEESEDDQFLRYVIIGTIGEYLEKV